jgi:hypothetical protein
VLSPGAQKSFYRHGIIAVGRWGIYSEDETGAPSIFRDEMAVIGRMIFTKLKVMAWFFVL